MEPEINASEFESAAQLAGEIRDKIRQLYVDWVWVNFSGSRQKVTPNTAEHICKGLMMAHELSLDQIAADDYDPPTPSYGVTASGGEMPKITPQEPPNAMSEIFQRTMFSVAYRVAQRMDRKNGRSAQSWTPEEAWDRLDSSERIMWRDESEKARMDLGEFVITPQDQASQNRRKACGETRRLPNAMKAGDKMPLHKYSGQNIPLEKLTLWFYHAHCREDADEIDQLEMAIEELFRMGDIADTMPLINKL